MLEVISIGSLVVDVFVTSNSFQQKSLDGKAWLCQPFGEKVLAEGFELHPGGGAGNTAVGFQRLGFTSKVIGELGKDELSPLILKNLQNEGVDVRAVISERKEQTGGSVIFMNESGERVVMVHRGAAAQLTASDISETVLKQARWIHISSLGGQIGTVKKIFAIAKQHQIGVSWNPGEAELLAIVKDGWMSLSPWLEILFVNEAEWNLVADQQTLIRAGIPIVVITKGSKGGQVLTQHQAPYTYPAKAVSIVDATGAGDAFAAAFVSARLCEATIPRACEWGAQNAAAVVKHLGAKAGLLTRSEMKL